MGQGGNTYGDSDCRDAQHTEPLTRCEDTQAGHSRDATAMATAFEPLTALWRHSLQGYPEPMNAVKSPEGSLRNQGAIKTNVMAVLIPG